MTGFGAADRAGAGVKVRVEARSVNHRHVKIGARLPGVLEHRAADVEQIVRARIERGSVSLTVSLHRDAVDAPARIVPSVLADYAAQFREAAEAAGAAPDAPLEAFLRLPGVVESAPGRTLSDEEFTVVEAATAEALDALVAMREREGASTAATMNGFIDGGERLAAGIEERVPAALEEAHQRLRNRVEEILAGSTGLPEEVVAREVAVLADKSDVAEEVARLRSHLSQCREALAAGGPVGRRLDFLCQELVREANTIGAKSSDTEIAAHVVELKLTAERFREQAANLE